LCYANNPQTASSILLTFWYVSLAVFFLAAAPLVAGSFDAGSSVTTSLSSDSLSDAIWLSSRSANGLDLDLAVAAFGLGAALVAGFEAGLALATV
jgi:hypothetical protein